MFRFTIPLLLCAALTVPGARAQTPAAPDAAAVPTKPVIVLVDMPDGAKPREYQTDEVSISISRAMDGRGDSRGDVSISLGSVRPFDTALLQWAKQGEVGPDASRKVVVTVPATPSSGGEERYELEGAKIVGFSASHSATSAATQLMLQVAARRVILNGVLMN